MACTSCGTGGCSTGGCKSSGLCASGSCNKMNSYDWIATLDIDDPDSYEYVEVSYKNGSRKEFFKNPTRCITGDTVLTEANGGGYDIGVISLSGELVRLQMRKKETAESRVNLNVIRRANERDLERLENKVAFERDAMIRARAISSTLGLEIKIGDVEYQGDMKKATFFFTANGRVDFRELVKAYVKEFKVKIEMRQIGIRQESARIGGLGVCGRELCCSTWLSDFRSVNTAAARYQNIAINQSKLSGQCGRLKCCLNYELDAYTDALQHFPNNANLIKTKKANASLVKTDIFKGLMYYVYDDITMRGVFHALDKDKVKEILDLNRKGIFPEDLTNFTIVKDEEEDIEFREELTGIVELPNKKKKKKKKKPLGQKPEGNNGSERNDTSEPSTEAKPHIAKPNEKNTKPNPNQKFPPRNNENRNSNGNKRSNVDQPKSENKGGTNNSQENNKGGDRRDFRKVESKNPNPQNNNPNPKKDIMDRINTLAEQKSDTEPNPSDSSTNNSNQNPEQRKKKKFFNKNKNRNK